MGGDILGGNIRRDREREREKRVLILYIYRYYQYYNGGCTASPMPRYQATE
jgi:hypothetical protein